MSSLPGLKTVVCRGGLQECRSMMYLPTRITGNLSIKHSFGGKYTSISLVYLLG